MATFTVFSTGSCPYCTRAKGLITQLNHTVVEKRVDLDQTLMEEVQILVPNVRTVPQIFIGDYHIGGFDDLQKLVHEDQLNLIIDMAG